MESRQRVAWVAAIVLFGCREQPAARPPSAVDAAAAAPAAVDAAVARVSPPPDAAMVAVDAAAAPPPAVDAAAGGASACAGAAMKKTYDVGDRGKKLQLGVGEAFAVELSAARHRAAWGEAALGGSSVALIVREVKGPPPDVDGGSFHYTYRFCATTAGVTELSIPSSGDEAEDAFTLRVTVR